MIYKKFQTLIKKLYSKEKLARTFFSIEETLKEKRTWKWLGFGMIVYGIPAIYRAITHSPELPFLPSVSPPNEYIPANLYEKLLINFIAPGGVGAKIGEIYFEKYYGKKFSGIKKYLSRLFGSVTTTSAWTSIQYLGYTTYETYIKHGGPWGGNPWESPSVYPFNLLMAIFVAPFFPYVVDCLKGKYKRLRGKFRNF